MSDYNFEPDYAGWWNDPTATKEDFCWLLVGLNPTDIKKYEAINKKLAQLPNDDRAFVGEFEFFKDTIPGNASNYSRLIKLDWGTSKRDFINNAYEVNHEFPPAFSDYLSSIGDMPHDPELEKYRSYQQYIANIGTFDIKSIADEVSSVALLFDLEPAYFNKYVELENIIDNQEYVWKTFTTEDNFFWREYKKFIWNKYRQDPRIPLSCLRRSKKYCHWTGDFLSYIVHLHNEGGILSREIYSSLESLSIQIPYHSEGWAVGFYQEWKKSARLWTLEDAAKLYLGADPSRDREFFRVGWSDNNIVGNSGRQLIGSDSVYFVKSDGTWDHNKCTSLTAFVRDHIDTGDFMPTNLNAREELRFMPEEIIKFFRDFCPLTFRPQALFIALGLETKTQFRKTAKTDVTQKNIHLVEAEYQKYRHGLKGVRANAVQDRDAMRARCKNYKITDPIIAQLREKYVLEEGRQPGRPGKKSSK